VFNRIIGAQGFELRSQSFLENCDDIISFAKNYFAVNFKLDYVKADGDVSNYIRTSYESKRIELVAIVETKGREEIDLPQKMRG
jgi:type III restriction enzyme